MKRSKIKKPRAKNKLKGINGWLLIILLIFAFSAVSGFVLLFQKIKILLTIGILKWGVWISTILLLTYSLFLLTSICLILKKRKDTIKTSIIGLIFAFLFSIWYKIIGVMIFYPEKRGLIMNNMFSSLLDFFVIILIIMYLKKSKRVGNTLVR